LASPGLVAAAVLASSAPAALAQAVPVKPPTVPVVRDSLPNGLTILVSEDHSAPIAAVTIWYHVGSKDEKVGRTGFAHLFEHMMFTGSQHIPPGEHPRILESIGADLNGTTNEDRTLYYDVVPAAELETALWLEADRMGFLLPALSQERLDAQRGIVQNERRQGVDNQPFGIATESIRAAMYPATNPYSWDVIGSLKDLSAASVDDVKDFFRKYYAPNNATLSIVGDVTPARAKALALKYFGEIPRGPAIDRPTVPGVRLASDKRLVLEDTRARTPQLRFAWPTIGNDHKDRFALSALGSVLTQDRTSRLTKALVYDRQLATSVNAGNQPFENAGMFSISVSPRPNASLTEIEQVVDSVIASIATTAPSSVEITRAANFRTVSSITGLQSDLNKAVNLANGWATYGDPNAIFKQISDFAAVKPADVQRVARQYLGSGHIVLSMVPAGKLDMVAKPTLPYTNITPKAGVTP
jgi:zinc protease